MATMSSRPQPLHLVFFPFLARSHMIPMLETARVAAERGVRITLVTTPGNAHLVRPTVDLRLIPFPAADFGLPGDCENLTAVPLPLASNFFNAVAALRGPLDSLLRDLRPDALISDALLPWTTALAAEHGIPRLIFQVTGLFPICAANDLDLHRPHEAVASGRDEPFTIPGFPHPVKLTRGELPEVFKYPIMLGYLREAELTSYGVVLNSFYGLEPDYAEHYYKVGPRKVFLVGPVSLAVAGAAERGVNDDDDPCLSWLDSKADRSVVYLSFGTLCRFSDEQLQELALGLEASGHPFVWVVRSDDDGWLPEGYEERVAGRGLLVRGWAPQVEILGHRAVGGYVIHCGWNSVMEAVLAGVPMATWPLHSEQFLIEKLLVDVLRVAIPVWEGPKSVWDEEKEVVRAAADGGSSYADMGRLIDGITALRVARK